MFVTSIYHFTILERGPKCEHIQQYSNIKFPLLFPCQGAETLNQNGRYYDALDVTQVNISLYLFDFQLFLKVNERR